jgi:general secretion pathway protein D
MKKALLLLLLSLTYLIAQNLNEISLLNYAKQVSQTNNINIFISQDLKDEKISFLIPVNIPNSTYLSTFKDVLLSKDLQLIKKQNYYIVQKYDKDKKDFYSYKLKNLNIEDLKDLLSIYSDIDYKYLKSNNLVVFSSNAKDYSSLIKLLDKIDNQKEQLKIKITILSTDNEKLKEFGNNIENLSISLQNTLAQLLNNQNQVFTYSSSTILDFKGLINLLQKENISKVLQSPIILLRHNSKSIFKSVKNIPFQTSKVTIEDNKVTTQDIIDYRDIGLNIEINPTITKDYIFLDTNLKIEDILTLSNNPITNKIELQNQFRMKKDEILFISGLQRHQTSNKNFKVPILGNIPILDYIFSYDYKSNQNFQFSIIIEVI